MPRSELVRIRAEDLEPGQRVRMPRMRGLSAVLALATNDAGALVVETEDGAYVCEQRTLVDVEDGEEQ